jgi:hypothetical protein
MAGKGISYIFIALGLMVLGVSTSQRAMMYIWEARSGNRWWSLYDWTHGDLSGMAGLDMVSKFVCEKPGLNFRHVPDTAAHRTNLYIVGDSYTRQLDKAPFAFSATASVRFIDRRVGGYYHLDTSLRNILILEVTEREIRSYLADLQLLNKLVDSPMAPSSLHAEMLLRQPSCSMAGLFPLAGISWLFNKYINQNLQCNLFNYNIIVPMFESKAALNYYLFNRADGGVVIAKNRDFLLLKETVTSDGPASSYSPVSNEDIDRIVQNLNQIYVHFRSRGFNEVYLSLIPNPATILQPEGYNQLIPRVQNNKLLAMQVLDIYSVFRTAQQVYYLRGDTHWNMDGKQRWVDLVNETINKTKN